MSRRAKMLAGYKIMPHTHPTDENVTVLSGAAPIVMGDKFDIKKCEAVRAGDMNLVDCPLGDVAKTRRSNQLVAVIVASTTARPM